MPDLDDDAIAALALPAGKARAKHAAGGGLFLWITPGRKRWVVRTPDTADRWGTDISIQNGDWPAMNLVAARKASDILLAMIEHGVDPVEQRRKARAKPKPKRAAKASCDVPTFGTLADEFVAFQKAQGARPKTLEKYGFLLSQLKAIYARPANSLDVKTLADCFGKIAAKDSRHETAKRAAILVGQILERAATTTNVGEQPAFAARLAAKGLPKVQTVNHPAIVDPARFGQLLRAIDGYRGRSPIVRQALQTLAYVFVRSKEFRSMRFEDVDLDARVWVIPATDTKQKRVQRVHLPRQAFEIIRFRYAVHHENNDTDVYVFPGARNDRVMSEGTLTSALHQLGFAGEHSAHGFRSSAKTIMHRELSIPRDVVESCLGHRLGNMTEQAYMHDVQDTNLATERAAAMQAYADYLDELRKTTSA